ncbi:MAG: hypothetical protein Kow00127_13840 [Bacteroidales bacterium]
MLAAIITGLAVSSVAILLFLKLGFGEAVGRWMIATGKFVALAGDPVTDDDEKQELLNAHFGKVAGSLLGVLWRLFAWLAALLLLLTASGLAVYYLLPSSEPQPWINRLFPGFFMEWPFIISTFIPVFVAPFVLKNSGGKSSAVEDPYPPNSRMMHYIFMGNGWIARALFYLEKKLHPSICKSNSGGSLYISGLARAGTTVLTQLIGASDEFRSLSYRNLPFVTMPVTGPKLIPKKVNLTRERFHRDGIQHSLESYEALEEPFWRFFSGKEYIYPDRMSPYRIDDKLYRRYLLYRNLIARGKIYLSKNNNHLLRAASLSEHEAGEGRKFLTIIPFRNPYAQASSLLKQHRMLSQEGSKDGFVVDYMDMLVHHEFGLNHKPQFFTEGNLKTSENKTDTLDYWLEVWYLYYSEVLNRYADRAGFLFFCYESFCVNPAESLARLAKASPFPDAFQAIVPPEPYPLKYLNEPVQESKYTTLYQKLNESSINPWHG